MTLSIFESLKEAYETSTRNNNNFAAKLSKINWDSEFYADGEYYFLIGDMTFTTPSLNPFAITKAWKPCAIFNDGSYLEF